MDRTIEAKYDKIADWYTDWLDTASWTIPVLKTALDELCNEISGQRILDVACGEGTFSRQLAEHGARVCGIDISEKLLELARRRTDSGANSPQYLFGDAQTLASIDDGSFDGAICIMALMDIPDLSAVYTSVRRVVRDSGWFVIAITHPCFDGPHAGWLNDDIGNARVVPNYLDEGLWHSRLPESIRYRVGANHRALSTYLNEAINTGWTLERILEPTGGLPGQNLLIPRLLLARFRAT